MHNPDSSNFHVEYLLLYWGLEINLCGFLNFPNQLLSYKNQLELFNYRWSFFVVYFLPTTAFEFHGKIFWL